MTEKPIPKVSVLEKHPEYPKAFGILSAEIGILEMRLGELLGAILGIKPFIGQVIYNTPKSYTGRLEILENVIAVHLAPTDGTHLMQGFIKRAKARIQYRNEAMHSLWGLHQADPSIVVRRSVPLLPSGEDIPVPITEIEEEIRKLRELIQDVEHETPEIMSQREAFFAEYEKSKSLGQPARTEEGDHEAPKTPAQ